jgi:hypothetical protein
VFTCDNEEKQEEQQEEKGLHVTKRSSKRKWATHDQEEQLKEKGHT